MTLPLEEFYERELIFLEELAPEFSQRFPAQAGRIRSEPGSNVDPHLERMIEGLALLAGRVRHKLDSDFPELTESLLQVLYPHLGLVIPPLGIVQVEVEMPGPAWKQGLHLPRGTRLHSRPLGAEQTICEYQLGYPLDAWPIRLEQAVWQTVPLYDLAPPPGTAAALRLEFSCPPGVSFAELNLDRLRLHLAGERQLIATLYDAFFHHCLQIQFRPLTEAGQPAISTPAEALVPVGLGLDEGLLPFPPESFVGYRLLMEMLSFPAKFHFVDLAGWAKLQGQEVGSKVEVVLFFRQTQPNLERGLSARNFLIGCAPVVNLFEIGTEPIDFHQTVTEYRVVPNRLAPQGTEVYAIREVVCFDPLARVNREYRPFYSYDFDAPENQQGFYFARRKASPVEGDDGTDTFLTLVDPALDLQHPSEAVLLVRALCTNRDLPSKFQQGGDDLFWGEKPPGLQARPRLLQKPTPPLRPALRRSAHWRLLSQNCLNHLSLVQGAEGRLALQEMLRLCDFSGPNSTQLADVNRKLIEGIMAIQTRPALARIQDGGVLGLCRGQEITVDFDEPKYIGTGLLLFAGVLERFFALYTGMNSFTQLACRTIQAEGVIYKRWPPRAAERVLA